MKITLLQAADILSLSTDEVLYIANNEKRINPIIEKDEDIVYNEDGTVSFTEGKEKSEWMFELQDVLDFKKQMDEGLVGEIKKNLND